MQRNPKPTGKYRRYLLGYVLCQDLCNRYETLNDQVYLTPEKAEQAGRAIQHRYLAPLAYRPMCYGAWKKLDLPPWPFAEIHSLVCIIGKENHETLRRL